MAVKHYPAMYKELMNSREMLEMLMTMHDKFENEYKKSQRLASQYDHLGDAFVDEHAVQVKESNLPANRKMLLRIRHAVLAGFSRDGKYAILSGAGV